ncbi:MerR family transcriptional regulator [Methylorubrum populi]|uniref:MerR family transcriptional regulator n=1 Tax=Methylorubrum populi TaxID=223967 RepID=UPI001FEEFB56|nr:helix-turn-helix domain-containing protein [Methylorubrum populi]
MNISIGELSRRAGVKVPTIRYYEGAGLMLAPVRTEGQQRRYSEAEVARLIFIKHSRDLGFEIDAIRELLSLSATTSHQLIEVDAVARRHLAEVERRIGQLTGLREELQRLVECHDQGKMAGCRLIEVLMDHDNHLYEHSRV